MDASQIGKRAWSYAGVLRDDGLSCFEYVEQLILLLLLKMADQLTAPPYKREPIVPPRNSVGRRYFNSTVPRRQNRTARVSRSWARRTGYSA